MSNLRFGWGFLVTLKNGGVLNSSGQPSTPFGRGFWRKHQPNDQPDETAAAEFAGEFFATGLVGSFIVLVLGVALGRFSYARCRPMPHLIPKRFIHNFF